jgi:hypothetical protein
MHRLQELFATDEGEKSFTGELRAMFEAGDLGGTETLLAAELETMDTDIARMCRELPREAVVLTGWEDLSEAISFHEGDPVTGVTLAIANEQDLAFEKGRLHEPYVVMGLYTDEAYAFSAATAEEMIAQCKAEEGPAWAGLDEDVELYLEVEGFGPLNTALVFHKQRHFFRDDNPDHAPMRYVDYVVGCWWRALRFQQAVAAEYAAHGLPGGIPVIAGMVELRPEVLCVHTTGVPAEPISSRPEVPEMPEMAEISASSLISRKPVEEEVKELSGSDLRRRFANSDSEEQANQERKGLLSRLFGR